VKALAALAVLAAALYLSNLTANPPGFFGDECSVSYNALTIARHGTDEWGTRLPFFFKALGDYKNPVLIYVLAAVFKVFGPSVLVARAVVALCGLLTAFVMAGLASPRERPLVFALTAFTPMLFEISRLVFEVAVEPLATALFLYVLWRARAKERWGGAEVAGITATLLLVTYAYSTGRLLGPLLLLGMAVAFYTPRRRGALAATVALYILLAAVPLAVYDHRHDGALTARFHTITYVDAAKPLMTLLQFEKHVVINLTPLAMTLGGDPNSRHHVPGSGGSILLITVLLAAAGAVVALRRDPRDRWTWFLLYGALASVVPASLTNDTLHTLRLASYPIFLIALSIKALEACRGHRLRLVAVRAAAALQIAFFVWRFETLGPNRVPEFGAGADQVVADVIAARQFPMHTAGSSYMNVIWFAALHGEQGRVSLDPPKTGDVFVTVEAAPPGAAIISEHGSFRAYVVP